MKDQIRLLRDCFHNEIPAVVFQGNDSCAGEILEAAKEIYQKHGCSEEFLYDWQMLINESEGLPARESGTGTASPTDPYRSRTDSGRNETERHGLLMQQKVLMRMDEWHQDLLFCHCR